MEHKFTKGHWRIDSSSSGYEDTIYCGDVRICQVKSFGSGFNDPSMSERSKNSKLIAAAPDLLEALEEIIPFASEWINDNHPAMIKSLNAIKKALE